MFEKILVPLDGSKLAELALYKAAELSAKFDSEAYLLHVTKPRVRETHLHHGYLKHASDLIRVYINGFGGIKADIKTIIEYGDPTKSILRFVSKNKIDLVVMSTHGRSGLKKWWLGSTANEVARESGIPVLLVRANMNKAAMETPVAKILVPLDGSKFAQQILSHVEMIAANLGSEIVLIRIVESLEETEVDTKEKGEEIIVLKKYTNMIRSTLENRAKAYLERVEKSMLIKGLKVKSVVLSGKVSPTIIQYADDNFIDLIAISTHGYTGINRWAFGSVAAKLVQYSTRPILVIRGRIPSAP